MRKRKIRQVFNVLLLLTDLPHTRRDSKSVRSIVAQTPWSGACARFALTNSAHLPSALPTGETFASFAPGLRPCVRIHRI